MLQKLSYLLLIFGLFPLVLLTGWAMSPWLNSVLPGWVDLLGGRQSARTLHFIAAFTAGVVRPDPCVPRSSSPDSGTTCAR